MFIIVYIIFVIINIIICSILAYSDYKSNQEITVSDIVMDLAVSALSCITTIAFLIIVGIILVTKYLFKEKESVKNYIFNRCIY